MNVIGYSLLGIEKDDRKPPTPCLANNIIFEDKNWFKTSLIEMLEKDKHFIELHVKEKEFIKKVLTVDILDKDTIFDVGQYNYMGLRLLIHNNDKYKVEFNTAVNICILDCITININNRTYIISVYRNNPFEDELQRFRKYILIP